MIWKVVKYGTMTAGTALVAGGLVFGSDLGSYIHSSCREVRAAVKDNIPIEFELRRARDLLDGVGPELHRNIRLVAEQEVEIANLKSDLAQGETNLVDEKHRVEKLRNCLSTSDVSFTFGDLSYSRAQLTQELSRQFAHYKEAENAIVAKRQLLDSRQHSLAAAMEAMETAKTQKATLEAQIDGLESQYRLVQAASGGTELQIDQSKLSQAQKVVGDIRKQLAVAEHVLAHEAKFTSDVPMDAVNEKDLLTQVDEHFGKDTEARAGN
ncbi:MAG TPA: hypothetical protein VN541_13225 [Tepidisphaeraceae bacterium]|nr:hypothetical protein [Tepidisphaeraceae bacterium]